MLERLESVNTWVGLFLVLLVVGFIASVTYVPAMARKRFEKEMHLEQFVQDEKIAPLLRTEQMWRDYAERATLRGDAKLADYYDLRADEVAWLIHLSKN